MAIGSIKKVSENAQIGTYSMKIDAAGNTLYSGYSNQIDVDSFEGNINLSCYYATANMSGSAARCMVHFYNSLGIEIGGPIIWSERTSDQALMKQETYTLLRTSFPVGTRFIALRFGVYGIIGMVFGDMWVDAVQATPGDRLSSWTPFVISENESLDDLKDGKNYARIVAGALDKNNKLDLASTSIVNRGALALLSSVSDRELNSNAVTNAKIALGAVDTNELAAGAVTTAKIEAGAVGNTELASDKHSLDKVSAGVLNGSTTNVASLGSGKTLNTQAGIFKPKTFTSMPSVGQIADEELFVVTAGSAKGIYIRTGATAMNGSGVTEDFNIS
jgi:hypothetical protein